MLGFKLFPIHFCYILLCRVLLRKSSNRNITFILISVLICILPGVFNSYLPFSFYNYKRQGTIKCAWVELLRMWLFIKILKYSFQLLLLLILFYIITSSPIYLIFFLFLLVYTFVFCAALWLLFYNCANNAHIVNKIHE